MERKSTNPKVLFNSLQYGFSQITQCEPGRNVFISGQVAWDENSTIVGNGDLTKQTMKSLENLKKAIESVGGTLYDIMMLRIYIVDYDTKDGDIISQALKDTFGIHNPPSSTWINVNGLANEEFMIEIEAQAVI